MRLGWSFDTDHYCLTLNRDEAEAVGIASQPLRRTLISFSEKAIWTEQIFCNVRGSSWEVIVIAPARDQL
jgi:hypothetical protein